MVFNLSKFGYKGKYLRDGFQVLVGWVGKLKMNSLLYPQLDFCSLSYS